MCDFTQKETWNQALLFKITRYQEKTIPQTSYKILYVVRKMAKFLLTVIRVTSPLHPTTYGLCQTFGMVKYYLGKQLVESSFPPVTGREEMDNLT